MTPSLPARIAWRYLLSRKSHSAVSAISIISVCGMAVATAAIICVLSVFNGFRQVMTDRLDLLSPDVELTPAHGKVFADADSLLTEVTKVPGVQSAMPVVCDNALILYANREMPVTLRGVVPELYAKSTSIDSLILTGGSFITGETEAEAEYDEWGVKIEQPAQVTLSIGVSARVGNALCGDTAVLFAPRREGRVNLANPISSFETKDAVITGIFQAQQSDYDENSVYCDIETARNLLQYEKEATAIEVKARPGQDLSSLADKLTDTLGPGVVARDRLRQHDTHFRMVNIEKWVSFILLFFILVIASFNIISTLSMLVIEKQHALSTLSSLGMSRGSVGAVFGWESIYVTAFGGIGGVILGFGLCLLQQHFGLLRLSGDSESLIVSVYPVAVEIRDIFITLVPIAAIGAVCSFISSRFAKSRLRDSRV